MAVAGGASTSVPVLLVQGHGHLPTTPPATLIFSPLPLPQPHRHRHLHLLKVSTSGSSTSSWSGSKSKSKIVIKATSSDESPIDANEFISDLKEKWDGVENKSSVILYACGAVAALWFTSVLVAAINSIPLVPKIMELVGVGYGGWFVYRYLLFKSSRKELATDIEALKKKISGTE